MNIFPTPRAVSLNWSFVGNINKTMKSTNGNIKGIKILTWNMRRGLLTNGELSAKMMEVMEYTNKNNIDILSLVETDLHSVKSRMLRKMPLTTSTLHQIVKIDGYTTLVPDTWETMNKPESSCSSRTY